MVGWLVSQLFDQMTSSSFAWLQPNFVNFGLNYKAMWQQKMDGRVICPSLDCISHISMTLVFMSFENDL